MCTKALFFFLGTRLDITILKQFLKLWRYTRNERSNSPTDFFSFSRAGDLEEVEVGDFHWRTLAISSVPLSKKSETLWKPAFLARGVRIPVASFPSFDTKK